MKMVTNVLVLLLVISITSPFPSQSRPRNLQTEVDDATKTPIDNHPEIAIKCYYIDQKNYSAYDLCNLQNLYDIQA